MACLYCVPQDKAMLETTGSEQSLQSTWAQGKLGQHSVHSDGTFSSAHSPPFSEAVVGLSVNSTSVFPNPSAGPSLALQDFTFRMYLYNTSVLFLFPLPFAAIRTTQP